VTAFSAKKKKTENRKEFEPGELFATREAERPSKDRDSRIIAIDNDIQKAPKKRSKHEGEKIKDVVHGYILSQYLEMSKG